MNHKFVVYWLWSVLLCLLFLFLVGGITRLTYSGLSITDWKPITGILPPLNDYQWTESFQKYQEYQEYQQVFPEMTLLEYKSIYFWEYFHRFLARFVGILFLCPFLFLWWRKKIPKGYHKRIFLGFILGGLQGVIGWLMVKTGLQENSQINHFSLAIHFCFALVLFSYLLWISISLTYSNNRVINGYSKSLEKLFPFFVVLMIAIGLQIVYGSFTAALKAGLLFNTYPLMDGKLFVPSLFYHASIFENLLFNPVMIQWIHRWLGSFIFIGTCIFLIYSIILRLRFLFAGLGFIIFLQFILGVLTLLYKVPLVLASLHQLVGILLWSILVCYLHYFYRNKRLK